VNFKISLPNGFSKVIAQSTGVLEAVPKSSVISILAIFIGIDDSEPSMFTI